MFLFRPERNNREINMESKKTETGNVSYFNLQLKIITCDKQQNNVIK